MSFLGKCETILFQGDSITDCKRDKDDITSLGLGYPLLVTSFMMARARGDYTFINKGISGNRTGDLVERWQRDCIDLKPTTVSILIGINDTWRRYKPEPDPTSTQDFYERYKTILTRTVDESEAKIIILEPFLLPVNDNLKQWREDLDPKIQAVRELSRQFGALYVPLDGLFAGACAKKPPEYWAEDGIHPTRAGHGLIAEAWVRAVDN